MHEAFCLYALTRGDASAESLGAGVDSRYPVERIRYGRLAALTSRVGLDAFDLTRLEAGTPDVEWLGRVALRHNEIIAAAACRAAVLPMRLGIFFDCRESLIAQLSPCETNAVEFLDRLEDRQEWGAKLYVDKTALRDEPSPGRTPQSAAAVRTSGADYLAARGLQLERRRHRDATIQQAIATAGDDLAQTADDWQALRTLPRSFTNRSDDMVWNGAFLLKPSQVGAFQAACEQLRRDLTDDGFTVEITGPWPPYHFCPASLTPETPARTYHAAAPFGHRPQL
jgi:hypothetical protein